MAYLSVLLFKIFFVACSDSSNISFKTESTWKIEFPEYRGEIFGVFPFRIITNNQKYFVDRRSLLVQNTLSYADIIDQALQFFNPSNEKLFSEWPYGVVTIRESEVEAFNIQLAEATLHIDTVGGGYYDKITEKFYDGIFMANSVPRNCSIMPRIIQRYTPCSVLENGPRFYMHPNQFYWITGLTPHSSEAVPYSTERQFIAVILGAYLNREELEGIPDLL
jgi:hypothetical protein